MVKLMTPEHFLMDKRLIERKEVTRTLDKKNLEQYLKSLPDSGADLVSIPIWENENLLPSKRIGKLLAQEKKPVEPPPVVEIDAGDEPVSGGETSGAPEVSLSEF